MNDGALLDSRGQVENAGPADEKESARKHEYGPGFAATVEQGPRVLRYLNVWFRLELRSNQRPGGLRLRVNRLRLGDMCDWSAFSKFNTTLPSTPECQLAGKSCLE